MHRNRITEVFLKFRTLIGVISFAAFNSYFKGFSQGIYTGPAKRYCTPFINCHSCPSATFACPVGVTQHVFTYKHLTGEMIIPQFVLGFMLSISLIFGKLFCGWLCPFGLIQTLLNRIKTTKIKIPHFATHLKYLIFVVAIVFLPAVTGEPWFCKLCPVGSLEAGIPLISFGAASSALRDLAQSMFSLKLSILLLTLVFSIYAKRPFCRLACPVGAVFSFFGRFSLVRVRLSKDACTSCGLCEKVCHIELPIEKAVVSGNCFLCGECVKVCKKNALNFGLNENFEFLFKKIFQAVGGKKRNIE
ncbi:4Fe-4S binding protein [candidate division WOR-3 bacterium]|nr:4Fe-4S binding protein [candidate division WOR-3 bacterium]